MVELLETAASFFFEAQVYEAVNEVYKLIIPIYESQRNHFQLGKVYSKLSECYKDLVSKGQHRFLCSYFRVGFYGLIFGDLDRQEFIYKEAALTRLGEFSLRLQVSQIHTMDLTLCHGVNVLIETVSRQVRRRIDRAAEGFRSH